MATNILLIHGGAHKGNCWEQLVPLLTARGFRVSAIDLPGHGRQSTFYYDVSLDDYATAVCSAAKSLGAPCVAVGHSLGGVSISMAATKAPELFERLIFVTALVPNGFYSRSPRLARDFVNPVKKGALPVSLLQGCMKPQAPLLLDYFYHDCPDSFKQRASDYLCNQPLRPMLGKIRIESKKIDPIPKNYIECTRDVVIPIEGQRQLQTHLTFESVVSLASGHSPFVSMPGELSDTIESIVR